MNVAVIPAVRISRARLARVSRCADWLARRALKPATWDRINIVLTDDKAIAGINQRFLRHKGPTDVISFRLDPMPGERGDTGEIYVNVQRAASLATKDWSASQELALYIAHGLDHLAGSDDATLAQRERMLKREQGWLQEAEKHKLLGGLLA